MELFADQLFGEEGVFLYLPHGPSQHFIINLPETFEEYLQKFSAKSRHNLRRSVRKLHNDTGLKVHLSRITFPQQVDAFTDSAVEISKKTYQWRLAGSGLRPPETRKQKFRFLAERGQLRSYLLWCGEEACAFMVGYQRNGVCSCPMIGYDPRWEKYSVGTIMHVLVIEDLFAYNRPKIFDFGTGAGGQKEYFGNASFFDADVYVLRKNPYTRLACGIHKAGSTLAVGTKHVLDHYGLKRRIKKLIRKASVASTQ
jgi:CelD/BcsL family acetyltransferase involved in cellulose biosynthesis